METTPKKTKRAAPKQTRVNRRKDALSAIQETVFDIVTHHPLPELLTAIVERAAKLLGADSGGMYLAEPEHRRARCVVSYNTVEDFRGLTLNYGEGAAGRVVESGQPLAVDDYHLWAGQAKVYKNKHAFKAVICVPMTWRAETIGALTVLREQKFSQEDVELLSLFASHAAVAVENARLYDTLAQELQERTRVEQALRENEKRALDLFEVAQRQAQELALLDKVRTVIAQELELPALLRRVVESISETFGYALVSLYLLEGDTLILQRQVGYERTIPRIAITEGVIGRVTRTGKAELLHDVASDPDFLEAVNGILSEICIPLFDHDRVAGVLNVESRQVRLTEADMSLMSALGEHIGMAISQARLYEDVKRRNQILSALQDSTLALMKQTGRTETLQAILEQAGRLMNTSHGYIYLVQPEENALEVILGVGAMHKYQGWKLKRNEGLAGKVWQTAQPIRVSDYGTWAGKSAQYEDMPFRAVVGVPLVYDERVIGVLGLAHIEQERVFSDSDVDILGYFSRLASIALENADLLTRVQHELADRKQAERALRQAEAQYRDLVERLPLVAYTSELGENGAWSYVSPQIESLLGYSAQEWMADSHLWYRQLHPEDRARQQEVEHTAYNTGQPFEAEYRIFTRDGRQIWVRDSGHILPGKSGKHPVMQGVLTDVTKQKRAEQVQSAFYKIADAAQVTEDLPAFYEAVHKIMCGLMPAANFYITLYDPANNLFNVAYKREDEEDNNAWLSYQPGKGLGSYILRTGKPIFVTPERFDELEKSGEVEILTRRMVDYIGVPLRSSKGIIGVMATQTYNLSERLTEADMDMMVFISTQVATAIERKRNEADLRESEERYRLLAATSPSPIFLHQEGRFTFINPAGLKLLGASSEQDLLGKPIVDVVHPDYRGVVAERVRNAIREGMPVPIIEEKFLRLDGSIVDVEVAAASLTLNNKPTMMVIAHDISERKQAESALRDSEQKYRALIEQLPAMIYVDKLDGSGSTLFISPQVESIFSVSRDEWLEGGLQVWSNLIHPEDRQHALELYQALNQVGQIYESEYRIITRDGRLVWVQDKGKVLRDSAGVLLLHGALFDVTEQKQAEVALRLAEERYRNLVEQIPGAVYLDKADEQSTNFYISPQVESLLGYPPAAYQENSSLWHQHVYPDDSDLAMSTVTQSLERGHAAAEYRLFAKDGRTIWVRDTSVLIRDESGAPKYIQGLLEDITERKRSEQLRESMYEIARAAISAQSLDELYVTIHRVLQTLLPTQYFYIALYDREGDLLSFPYFQDVFDEAPPPSKPGRGLTEYVLRARRPLLATREVRSQMIEAGEVELIGADSIEWLGVPLTVQDEAIGVMVVQSYDEAVHFSKRDMEVLSYVSTQVASAIERKRNEEALKESEARFHSLFDNATVGIYRTTPDGRILLSNPAAIRMLGYASFEELAQRNLDESGFENQSARAEFLERIERDGSVIGLESAWLRKDGSTMYVRESATAVRDERGAIMYYDGVFEDITDRKQAEDALKQSEMFARSIIENEPECVKIVGPDGVLEYMNPAGLAMIEVPNLDMVRGKSVYPIVVAEHRRAFKNLTERVLRGESGTLQFQMVGLKGTRRWLDTHAVPLYDQQGRVTALLGITRDITERKQAEALQEAVYSISNAAETAASIAELFPQIHKIVSSVMPAENFFITLYDEEKNVLRFPYFQDAQDEPFLDQFEPGKGLTAYVLRTGKPLLCTQEVHKELERQGAVELVGAPSKIWLGAPLLVEGKPIGVMVVQHYTDPNAYGERELHILEFVSSQVAVAIQRKQAREALQESEQRYRTLFAGMLDGVYLSTHNGKFVDVNPAMVHLFGYASREEMLQIDIRKDLYFAPEERESLFLDTGQEKVDIFRMKRKDGSEIWVEDHGRYVHDEQGNVLYHEGILRDVTERIRADREIKRLLQESQQRLRQVEALRSIDLAIGSSMDLRTTLNILLSYIKSLLVVDAASILLFNPNSQSFEFAAGSGQRVRSPESLISPMGNSLAGKVALERRTLQFTDPPDLLTNRDFLKIWKSEGYASYTGAPLIAKGELKGVLEVYHRSPFQPDAQWMDLLQNFSIQASIAIDNAQLFNDLQRSNFELSLAYDATIEGWSRALELREYEIVGHAQRLTDLTLELARLMGLRDSEMIHIRRGALLHDIGKMGIPDSILMKTAPLTEEEWKVMRLHPIYAYEMLSPIAYLRPALDIPYCHHEYWDGSGYPRGLSGEEIPPAARIFAVADVYESMTSDRVYRKRLTKEEALQYIKAQTGKQFDPKVAATFLQLMTDGEGLA